MNLPDILLQEFPNLPWINLSSSVIGYYRANAMNNFVDVTVEVFPEGCLATIRIGGEIVSRSPNEKGKSLEEVVSHVRKEWDKLAFYFLKSNPDQADSNFLPNDTEDPVCIVSAMTQESVEMREF